LVGSEDYELSWDRLASAIGGEALLIFLSSPLRKQEIRNELVED